MSYGLKPVWAGRNMRLDPGKLPQKVSYGAFGSSGNIDFTINQGGVVIRRKLASSRLPLSIMLPAKAYRGVAARAIEEGDTSIITLELLHVDEDLCVPLLVANDFEDISGDWRAWSETFGLPMLLVEADGEARTLSECTEGEEDGPVDNRSNFRMTCGERKLGLRMSLKGVGIV